MTNYIFDGGTIDDPSVIRLQADELDDARFWTWEQAETKMPAGTAARVPAARKARQDRRTIYLPAAGEPAGYPLSSRRSPSGSVDSLA